MKTCTRCGETKPLTAFRRDSRRPDGRHSQCKSCRSLTDKTQKLRKQYGLTLKEWQEMYLEQRGVCMVCGEASPETLNVDHCHTTKQVRGLLCGPCNRAIGLFKDNPETIARAAIYVARNQ